MQAFLRRVYQEMKGQGLKLTAGSIRTYIWDNYPNEDREFRILLNDIEYFLAALAGKELPNDPYKELHYRGRRVDNLGKNVTDWNARTGDGSSMYDVCNTHAEQLDQDPNRFNDVLKPYGYEEPQGADGWGGDVEHPPYNESDYRCAIPGCRVRLGD